MTAAYFDEWYANMTPGGRQDEIQHSSLGLPPGLESTSLLPWDGIADVVAALALEPGDTVIDLACGRGGYGLEIARRTGAVLVGIDFSTVAIGRARELAAAHWDDVSAEFEVGELTASGRPEGSAAAVLCVDAMQFAAPYAAGIAECLRILVPGGRLAITGWQPRLSEDPDVPERIRHDIGAAVAQGGFGSVEVHTRSEWQDAERRMWQAAVAAEPGDDPAMQSMHDEGARMLPRIDRLRRVLVTARRPR